MPYNIKFINLKCDKCGKEFELSKDMYAWRKRKSKPNYCKECMQSWKNNNISEKYKNLSEENRNLISENKSKAIKSYWDNLSEGERFIRGDKIRKHIQSLSDKELKIKMFHINEGNKKWRESITDKDEILIKKRCRNNMIKRWENITREEYQDFCLKCALNKNSVDMIINVSSNEKNFINYLNIEKIDYKFQYYNITKHDEFDKLFPFNPVTNSDRISPYHQWDFLIKTKKKNILVDIDGSIHDSDKTDYFVDSGGIIIKLKDLIDFNDSQRPYQTDGLEAYIIKCYDDTLTDETEVVSVNDDSMKLTFKQFISYLILMNY